MTPTRSSTSPVQRRTAARETGASPRRRRARARRERGTSGDRRLLGRYTDRQGRAREVVARPGAAGSVLVGDRDCTPRGERRLVAHLAADEPA